MRYLHRTTKRLLAAGAALTAIVKRSGRGLGPPAAATLLLIFLLIVSGPTPPVSAADPSLPAFGEGVVEVRVYTDYFCGPCRAEEQEVMAAITELVAKNRIRVLFIDTPLHPETVLYAGYFLAAVNAKREFGQAVKARAALFEAAGLKIRGERRAGGLPGTEGPADPAVRHRPRLCDIQQIHQGRPDQRNAHRCHRGPPREANPGQQGADPQGAPRPPEIKREGGSPPGPARDQTSAPIDKKTLKSGYIRSLT